MFVVTLVLIGLIIATPLLLFFYFGPGYKRTAADFFEDIEKNVDPKQLQAWAEQEIASAPDGRTSIASIPAFINTPEHGPPRFAVLVNDGDMAYVHLYWGGGFGHWGIKAGKPDLRLEDDAENYYLPWVDGVYVWHEKQ